MKPIPVAAGSSLGYNPGMGWNVYGHEWASEMLKEHIARSAVRHAYLFTGPPGVGRRTLALRFAQALNCTEPPEPGQPCGKCRTCLQIERMQQADLSIVQAEQEGVPYRPPAALPRSNGKRPKRLPQDPGRASPQGGAPSDS
jgi:hypothetical protein